ncbi:autophagy protein 5 [Thecaphora frezii]
MTSSTISTPQIGASSSFASPSTALSSSPLPSFAGPSVLGGGNAPHFSLQNAPPQPNTTFRRLVWSGTIPIAVTLDASDLPPGSDQSLASTYLLVPRVSYLPLIVQDVRRSMVELVLDDAALASLDEKEWWFEYEGQPLRWHWPIGLLYDYHTSNPASSSIASGPSGTAGATSPSRSDGLLASATPAIPLAAANQAEAPAPGRLPWNIRLRLSKPPLDKLHSKSSVDICKTSFMSMIKEADFVRYGSTKKVVNLRRQEQDALWEGVVQHDFDAYWSVAHKLVPSTQPVAGSNGADVFGASDREWLGRGTPSRTGSLAEPAAMLRQASFMSQSNESQASLAPSMLSTMTATTSSEAHTSIGNGGGGAMTPSGGGAASGGIRSVPIRILLPDAAPVVQEPVAPLLEDGRPATLATLLSSLFPLLFPPPPSFSSFQAASPPLAYAVVQGVRMPLDAEVGWLGSTMLSPDGWLTIVIGLLPRGATA